MAIGAIVSSQITIELDRNVGTQWMSDAWWTSLNQPDGARALLATVAGSMITVTGVTFSLTILAVSYATSHFGPRLLDNFMRDRGNQITLGTFVATFLYCLLVLRTVRAGSNSAGSPQTDVFVPHLSVLIALILTLASVGVLIYFIHHIPESMHISNVLDRISCQMTAKIQELYPEQLGEPADVESAPALAQMEGGIAVSSELPGYLQGVDDTSLLEFASEYDAIVQLLVRPGDYLLAGQQIALISATESASEEVDGKPFQQVCEKRVSGSLAIGVSRTPTQDIFFIVNQFVEIAARALSPGVNDPFTAIQCIDNLATGFVELSNRQIPSRFREDQDGKLRVVAAASTWADFVDRGLRRLLPYVKRDPNVSQHMIKRISQVIEISQNAELNQLLCEVRSELDE